MELLGEDELESLIRQRSSYLCVGLDPDRSKIPRHLLKYDDPVFEFCHRIFQATKDYCVAYKPNMAFFEALGSKGWLCLEKLVPIIGANHFVIADAKRGDIGNTASHYAKAIYDRLNFDAITLNPYMGLDTLKPFSRKGKWSIVLALTSNPGSADFEMIKNASGDYLFESVIKTIESKLEKEHQRMYVVGATKQELLSGVREICPERFFLVPGVGAQGGDLKQVTQRAGNSKVGLLVNSSRKIIYSSDDEYFDQNAAKECIRIQNEMKEFL